MLRAPVAAYVTDHFTRAVPAGSPTAAQPLLHAAVLPKTPLTLFVLFNPSVFEPGLDLVGLKLKLRLKQPLKALSQMHYRLL